MTPSANCIAIVKKFEGLRHNAYQCPAGVWTIGYGTTAGVKPGDTVSDDEACALLMDGLTPAGESVAHLVTVSLTQSQFDALTCFVYNIGVGALRNSTLLSLLNAGNYAAAEQQFARWDKAGGRVMPGLTSRRMAERELFCRG